MTALSYGFWGALFGFILSRAGATDFNNLHEMFTLREFHMYGIIGSAIPVIMFGFAVIRKLKKERTLPASTKLPTRRWTPGTLPGAVLFGLGWGLSGTCPGPAIIQVGEGNLLALVTVGGILLGNRIYRIVHAKYFKWTPEVCG